MSPAPPRAASELVLNTEPDVAVVDLHLASEGGGDALIRRLAESDAHAKIVVFTATTDPTELHAVLKAGADGIVLKEGGLPELIAGLEAVTRGEQYLSPSLAASESPTSAARCGRLRRRRLRRRSVRRAGGSSRTHCEDVLVA